MNGQSARVLHDTTLVFTLRCLCACFLWMTSDIRSYTVSTGLQVSLSSLGHCLNRRYKNGVLLHFTAPTKTYVGVNASCFPLMLRVKIFTWQKGSEFGVVIRRDMLIWYYSRSDNVFGRRPVGKNRITEYLGLCRSAFAGMRRINTCEITPEQIYHFLSCMRCVIFERSLIYDWEIFNFASLLLARIN